ncbi:histidine kinase [Pseudoflavitalea sp. X16]|uniref:sensor histidine kinase n=1 Tax=Paraflavitalea devenefica TaxID=2716334 RepID=UPI00142436C7|nr:histidine kinase [Paraflavitalea devenefica]NII28525.1 histidine kinase [Paraflavitalea devenefica]
MRSLFLKGNLFHWLFWGIYIIYGIMDSRPWIMKKGFVWSLQPLLLFFAMIALLLYGNIRFLIPVFLEKKKIVWYIIGLIAIIVLYTYLRSFNQQYWDAQVWPDEPMALNGYLHWNVFNALWFLVMSSLLYYAQKSNEQRQQVKNIQISQLQTELKYLRAQVNPHFLFNGLNTIYGSIDRQNQQARDILLQFADLLRYNLYEADVDWVELEKETLYLQNYVALQRARSDSNVQITLDINVMDGSVKIAPLIFLAFVENAFKYSTRDDNRSNVIKISLQQAPGRIEFTCSNTYEQLEQEAGGIGLSNVMRRLELLYKDHYTLNIMKDQAVYTVHLTLLV